MICVFIMSVNTFMHRASLMTLLLLTVLIKTTPFINIETLKNLNGPWKSLLKVMYTYTEDIAALSIFIENKFTRRAVDFSENSARVKSFAEKYDKLNDKHFKEVYLLDDLQLHENEAYNPMLNWMLSRELNQINVQNMMLQDELRDRLDAIYYMNDTRQETVNVGNLFTAVSTISSSDMDYYYRHTAGGCCCGGSSSC